MWSQLGREFVVCTPRKLPQHQESGFVAAAEALARIRHNDAAIDGDCTVKSRARLVNHTSPNSRGGAPKEVELVIVRGPIATLFT